MKTQAWRKSCQSTQKSWHFPVSYVKPSIVGEQYVFAVLGVARGSYALAKSPSSLNPSLPRRMNDAVTVWKGTFFNALKVQAEPHHWGQSDKFRNLNENKLIGCVLMFLCCALCSILTQFQKRRSRNHWHRFLLTIAFRELHAIWPHRLLLHCSKTEWIIVGLPISSDPFVDSMWFSTFPLNYVEMW